MAAAALVTDTTQYKILLRAVSKWLDTAERFFVFARSARQKIGPLLQTTRRPPSAFHGSQRLHKTECFCFWQTTLEAHQSMHMPIIFHFDNQLPTNISEVRMSYTLFKVKAKQ